MEARQQGSAASPRRMRILTVELDGEAVIGQNDLSVQRNNVPGAARCPSRWSYQCVRS